GGSHLDADRRPESCPIGPVAAASRHAEPNPASLDSCGAVRRAGVSSAALSRVAPAERDSSRAQPLRLNPESHPAALTYARIPQPTYGVQSCVNSLRRSRQRQSSGLLRRRRSRVPPETSRIATLTWSLRSYRT